MGDGSHVFSNIWKESLGDLMKTGLTYETGEQTFQTKTVQNGNVTHIKMTPVGPENLKVFTKKKDGKQVVNIPQGIPEEKSNPFSEASNEAG